MRRGLAREVGVAVAHVNRPRDGRGWHRATAPWRLDKVSFREKRARVRGRKIDRGAGTCLRANHAFAM
jgi:hypothetical protein